MTTATATARRLSPLEHEALLLRHQQAIDVLRHPEVAEVPAINTTEDRVSLLAAVVWPCPELLQWSIAQARHKLERHLG